MAIACGLDIGLVSIKLALIGDAVDGERMGELAARTGWLSVPENGDRYYSPPGVPLLVSEYRRVRGRPVESAARLLAELLEALPAEEIAGLRLVGSGSRLVASLLGVPLENEFRAIARGFGLLYPTVRTVFEMGGETSKYLQLERDPESGAVGIADYETNGDCAAGTGSFLDQQASRLQFRIEDVGRITAAAERSAQIAGRCSVFAKSDMIHAQQKGYAPQEVMRGLCLSVARNFKSAVVKSKPVTSPVAFIGGVAANSAVVRSLNELYELGDGFFVPSCHAWMGAIGAALIEKQNPNGFAGIDLRKLAPSARSRAEGAFPKSPPLSLDNVVLLRENVKPYVFPDVGRVDTYLGIDVGSVSTNLVLIDESGAVVTEIYTRTNARPIEVVSDGLKQIETDVGHRVNIKGVATTGSGRELIGALVGADTVNDEITAHKTGADFIARQIPGQTVDTIFEIGGQDSKFISLQDGIVVDFTMNEACAAGTGSFLEERCEELDISIYSQFAKMALSSKRPIRLGERCTVFMEQDVNAYLKRGAPKEDLTAGLAYSVVLNYINRVVRGRNIGENIFFQGGTAYNDAVAAAFAGVLGKRIIVPPHNGVIGAIGVALLAREKMNTTGQATRFRGYHLDEVKYKLREFTCKGCTNFCTVQQFDVDGEKTYWGDKCSEKYRKQAKTKIKPVIPDLAKTYIELMLRDYEKPAGARPVIGIPRAMYTYERFPFWNRFFAEIGHDVLLSEETNTRIAHLGSDTVLAEPCFPIMLAHGHTADLVNNGVDYVFIPNQMNSETPLPDNKAHVCPWGQTLPWVIRRSPAMNGSAKPLLAPKIEFRENRKWVTRQLVEFAAGLGVDKRRTKSAVEAAFAVQQDFRRERLELGRQALAKVEEAGAKAVVLIGRPYNIYDRGVNLSVATRIRESYGVNVIPIDFLELDAIPIDDINDNMYWNYGRRIIAAAKLVGRHEHLHIIYITNFKCGPDSYIKHYIKRASGKPFLSLQFDGHSNDAGMMTRCEAYLDSKGFLRWWKSEKVS